MNTNKRDWYRIKGYPHIGLPLKQIDRIRVANYVSNSDKIAIHAFLPFIHKTIKTRKFRKSYDEDGKVENDGLRVSDSKTRDIYYANHFDSNIFSYYSSILNKKYEQKLKELDLTRVITAYRRIPLQPDIAKSRNMNNIDFANEVFDFIRDSNEDDLVAISFDIKGFFDNLDHQLLKQRWCSILNEKELPESHYNVFRNIIKFSYVEEKDLFNAFKHKIIVETKSGIRKIKKVDKIKYLKNQGAIAYCEKEDFLKQKNSIKGFIKANKYTDKTKKELRIKGIPQGSPLSSVLANVYMLDFDKEINNFLVESQGLYRRYSDDMVVVCKAHLKADVIDLFENEIRKFKLEIQSSKTQIFHFVKTKSNYSCFNETASGLKLQTKRFEYLGFEFDGEYTFLKSSSLSSYYRKMKRALSRSTYYAKFSKNKELKGEIFRKRMYKKYSYKGAERRRIFVMDRNNPEKWTLTHKYDWGNYLSYTALASYNMNKNKINNQLKRHWGILNGLISEKEKMLKRRSARSKKMSKL